MTDWTDRHALVIGAGIAGMCAADSLAARGWRVTVLDGADGVARGASSTPAGAMHALLSRDDSRLSRFTRAAYLHMDRRLATLGAGADWAGVTGRVHCTDDGVEAARELVESLGLPPEYVSAVDAEAASDLAGTRVARGGWWFPRTAWLHAGSYCAAVLAVHEERVTLHPRRAVTSLTKDGAGWTARDANGGVIASAPVAVLASGLALPQLLPGAFLNLQCVRGQLTGVPAASAQAPRVIVSGEGYCLPVVRGVMWTGATYAPRDDDFTARDADHAQNLRRLAQLLPGNASEVPLSSLASHVGMRAVSSDRLPLVGPVPQWEALARGMALEEAPRQPGLYVTGGMGSRGLTWAALCGEVIAAHIEEEVPPLEADLLDAIDPARFALRQLKRG